MKISKKEQLENKLRRKEVEASKAKEKGMQTTYKNLLSEISVLKSELVREDMGLPSRDRFSS